MTEAEELKMMLDWQPPEIRGDHTFRRAAATEEFSALYAENRAMMRRHGIAIFTVHTNGDTEFAWFTSGKHASKT